MSVPTIYRNEQKGGLFEIICKSARDSQTSDRLILYRCLETRRLWATPAEIFFSEFVEYKFIVGKLY